MLSLAELQEAMTGLLEWSIAGNSIEKVFSFNNFKESLAFVNKIAEIAELQNHHPDIMINYNLVRFTLTTHSEGGVTKKDIELAKEIDKISND